MTTAGLVRLRIVFYTVWALAAAWSTAMADVKWADMGWEARSCLVAGMVMQWTGVMVAFFDKSVWRRDAEKNGELAPPNKPGP